MLTLDHITTPLQTISPVRPLYQNDLLSVSRLKKFEQCPKAFEMHYIQRLSGSQGVPLVFGNLCHDALEDLYKWVLGTEYKGPFPKDRLMDRYQTTFESSGLATLAGATSSEVFEEGRSIMNDFANRNGMIDHREHIAAEMKFEIAVGTWKFIGYIDRLDQPEPKHIVIRDYKTNRVLFSRADCDSDLQASIYHVAARQMFPEAEKFTFVFDMLRHNVELETFRDDDQMAAAVVYCEGLARQSENNEHYPAQFNTFCAWCDNRGRCDEYQNALNLAPAEVVEMMKLSTPEGITAIAEERERVAYIAKLFAKRKDELEKLIKAVIRTDGPVRAAGMRYTETKARQGRSFQDPDKLISFMAGKNMGTDHELRSKLMVLDPKKVDDLVKKHAKAEKLKSADAKMLKLQIDAMAKTGYSTRFDARKDKDAS